MLLLINIFYCAEENSDEYGASDQPVDVILVEEDYGGQDSVYSNEWNDAKKTNKYMVARVLPITIMIKRWMRMLIISAMTIIWVMMTG